MDIKFWADGKERERVDPKLFSKVAEELAIKFAKDYEDRKRVNKRTQLRKFYDEVVRLDSAAKSRPQEDWNNILPQVHMLVAKAAYAKGRDLVSEDFKNFISKSVEQIQDKKDLSIFATFFESVMGFYRLHGPNS